VNVVRLYKALGGGWEFANLPRQRRQASELRSRRRRTP
jgi:hypothetical protein